MKAYKQAMRKRQVWMESMFAEAKAWTAAYFCTRRCYLAIFLLVCRPINWTCSHDVSAFWEAILPNSGDHIKTAFLYTNEQDSVRMREKWPNHLSNSHVWERSGW